MKKWFISDTHFSHSNIIKYTGRPFETVEEMNRCLIRNWNDCIDANDQVFFLGDFGLGDVHRLHSICSQLKGHKICIRGNHDRNASHMMRVGFSIVLESAFLKIASTQLNSFTFLQMKSLLIFNYMDMSMKKDQAKSYLINSIYVSRFGTISLSLKKQFLAFLRNRQKINVVVTKLKTGF
jgi:calcineurin-like phosphoesterase family protein